MDDDADGAGGRERIQDALVAVLLSSPTMTDRQARALLFELVAERIGHRPSLREQPTARLELLELVRYCAGIRGGLEAVAQAVRSLVGPTPAAAAALRLAAEWEPLSERQSEPEWERTTVVRFPPAPADARPLIAPPSGSAIALPAPSVPAPSSATPGGRPATLDFFISYTGADRAWAEWVAWALEQAGYYVVVQAWDFVPGTNWYAMMQAAAIQCDRTIALLSPDYLKSAYAAQEWQAAQQADPKGLARKLVPIRIAPCSPPGLLATVLSFDLFGLSDREARTLLLGRIAALRTGRDKPADPPPFPG